MADNVAQETTEVDTEATVIDNGPPNDEASSDPMLVMMRESEAEIAAQGGNAEGQGVEQVEEPGTTQIETQTAQPAPKQGGDTAKQPVMVPIARLNDALNQRDRYKEEASYFKGVATVQTEILKSGQPTTAQTTQAPGSEGKAEEAAAPVDANTQIDKLQDDKIALAQKYEDGEISLVEFKKQEIALDKQIRTIDDKRVTEMVDGAKKAGQEIVQTNNVEQHIRSVTRSIQNDHPYVAEIDKLPAGIRDGVWQEIANKAVLNLAQRGINPNDGTVASREAFIKEKAALTNEFGPRYTGVQLTSQPKKSEVAQQRENKLNLAQNHPPAFSGMASGGQEAPVLTEAQLEGMTQEQVADALAKNPHAVLKAAGMST